MTSLEKVGPAISLAIIVALVAALPSLERASDAVLANMGVALAVAIPSILIHELWHAAAARAAGLRVIAVVLGRGQTLWAQNIGGTQLALRALPFAGLTLVCAPTLSWIRSRLILMYAAGPLSNALLALAAWPLSIHEHPARHVAPFYALLVVNVTLVAVSALPIPRMTGQERPTDGWNILALPFRRDRDLASLRLTYQLWEAERCLARGDIDRASALMAELLDRDRESFGARWIQSYILLERGRWAEAAAGIRALMSLERQKPLDPQLRSIIVNNLAWALVWMDDPVMLEEADVHSKEALARLPKNPAVQGTRGAVLLARGDLDEAEERLRFAFERSGPKSKALGACCLAMVHAKRGLPDQARAWLERARVLGPSCVLLGRAAAAIEAGRGVTPTSRRDLSAG